MAVFMQKFELLKTLKIYCTSLHSQSQIIRRRVQYSGLSHFVGNEIGSTMRKTCINTQKRLKVTMPSASVKSKYEGPSLEHFMSSSQKVNEVNYTENNEHVPYVNELTLDGQDRKVYFETYGCQMNVNDTEIAWSILKKSGYIKTDNVKQADVILLVTCAIRENAELKIWHRLEKFASLKKHTKKSLKIGVLGCMAERLKQEIVEKNKMVDLVCGPDAYRDLPRMLSVTHPGQAAINVILSLDETYADVMPVRINENTKSAFVSIMRGCNNMCTYCIVPFTRGRERSRPIQSIVDEVKWISEQGGKEVTLLGQNVNSYRDTSEGIQTSQQSLSKGFKTVYKAKQGGTRFSDLLDQVSLVDPEMRIRFTSPHPKDFPDEVLQLIRERPNICNQIHLPAQSGNSDVLEAMRRGYTREAYLELVHHIRDIIPGVSLSSDFISGFCGETEGAHTDTVTLLEAVKYNYCYTFAYSMRQKTKAYHRLIDDVPYNIKCQRVEELAKTFRREALRLNLAQIGEKQLVLVEGDSRRSNLDLAGRNDGNTKVIVPNIAVPIACDGVEKALIKPGDYVVVQITEASYQILKGAPLYQTTLQEFSSTSIA